MAQKQQRLLLLLPLLLAAATLANCQLDAAEASSEGEGGGSSDVDASRPAVGSFFPPGRVTTIKTQKYSTPYVPGAKVTLRCAVTSAGFHAWVKGVNVVGSSPTLEVVMNNTEVFGVYTCVAKSGDRLFGMDFVVNEMPSGSIPVAEMSVGLNANPTLKCRAASSSGTYKWYRYNDESFRFEEMSGRTEREIRLQYSELAEKDKGFTFYKCLPNVPGINPENFEAFKLVKEPREELIDGKLTKVYQSTVRPIPADVGAVPVAVTPNSKVTFACEKVSASDSAKWYFRSNETTSPQNYTEMPGVDVNEGPTSSVLSVNNCDVRNKGYYRCNVGGVIRYAFLDIQVIVPTIHDYSKMEYRMADANELECEVPSGGKVNDVVWRVVPPSGDSRSPFDIRVNQAASGFTTSVKDVGINRLVTISFRDSPDLHAYRLECRLGDELDYVLLRHVPTRSGPSISISVEPSDYPGYRMLVCNHSNLTDPKFHINDRKEDPIGPPQGSHTVINATHCGHYFQPTKSQHWFRCSAINATNARVYSEPVPLVKDPLSVQIMVDGVVLDPTKPKAKVAGQRTEIVCNFTNFEKANIQLENVKLEFQGRILTKRPETSGDGKYRFVFESPEPADSGTYRCKHLVEDIMKRVDSRTATVNWCNTDQFMCDGGCKDNSVKCNGTQECADGTDELPVLCAECEPNEVPCGTWGSNPQNRKCVLKHWLCDGQDDCGNRYDEESPVAKAWCVNTCQKPTITCPANSTCCKIEGKCILRAYECDRENDCPIGSSDESNCCSLRLESPTAPQTMERTPNSTVRLTCRASGFERPTINWRCNWGHLRDPERMTESNRVLRMNPDGTYQVEGTLVITNFTKADECIYNCEVITKCKRELSPEFDVKVP